MAGHGEKFGRKKEEAIAALLSQRNLEEAAHAAGIGTRTLLRWMQVPEFSAAYRRAHWDAVSQSTARLQQATGAAASTLLKVMIDPNTPASTKVRAAECVLNHSAKQSRSKTLKSGSQELERSLAAKPATDRMSAKGTDIPHKSA
jgi:hypothetical protein